MVCKCIDSFRRFDLIRETLVLQQQVLPGLNILQLERITLEAEVLEGVFGNKVTQTEAQVFADRDELQSVRLELPAYDNERFLVQVVQPHRAGARRGCQIETGELPDR